MVKDVKCLNQWEMSLSQISDKTIWCRYFRFWVASVDYTADVRISMDNFKQVSEVYRKIRNTIRFLLGNLNDFDPKQMCCL